METITKNGWHETTLGEVAQVITGKTPPTANNDLYGDVYPFITPTDIDSSSMFCTPERKLSESGKAFQRSLLLPPNTICYTCIASVGKICMTTEPSFTNQQINAVIADETKADRKFLFYILKYLTPSLKRIAGGTTTSIINKSQFEDFAFALPPLNEQRSIATVLSSMDDKIELLRKQNETLEQIAQATFNEWFVKPTQNEVLPEGWVIKGLSEVADFLNGIALQKYPAHGATDYLPAIKIRELNSGITDATDKISREIPEKYIVSDGDVLFSWSGSLEVVIWQHGEGALNQHLFKVSSERYPKWFYYFWLLHHLSDFRAIAENKATTMGHIQRYHLDQAKVATPDDKTLQTMDAIFAPLLAGVISNSSQMKSLISIRDLLLPRLMSGEIRV